jgi:putative cell wall-binding protein
MFAATRATAWTRHPIRVAGDDRYSTAVALSQAVFPDGARTVVVASGEAFPDALAASAVAGANHGPLLLTAGSVLPDVVAAELQRLAPTTVAVLGGPMAVSNSVLDAIQTATGIAPVRIAGSTRYDTAAAAAAYYPTGGTAFVAAGTAFADGLTGGAAAGHTGRPLLLSSPDVLPSSTEDQLRRLQPAEIVVVGGPAAVGDDVLTQLRGLAPSVRRIAGADRFGTSEAVASEFFPQPPEALLVSGLDFPDALAAGPIAATLGDPLLLTLPACVPPSSVELLQADRWPDVTVVGGPLALWPSIEQIQPCSAVPDGDLAPGVRLDTIVVDGPNVARIVTLDRAQGFEVRSTTATGGLVGRLPTTDVARRWSAVVAVTGDFFLGDGEPAHAFATGGRMLKAPALVEDQIGFSATDPHVSYGGTPAFAMVASVTETGAAAGLDHINEAQPATNELSMYTPEGLGAAWPPDNACTARLQPSQAPRVDAAGNAFQLHKVVGVSCDATPPPVANDDLLVALDDGSSRTAFLKGLTPGQHVDIGWRVNPDWPNLLDSTGSNTTLVHNGAPSDDAYIPDPPFYTEVSCRTAVGRLADGRDVLVELDGRQPGYSIGMTPLDFANFLVSIGVVEATNLDGGGSATLVVNGLLVNHPSDPAGERAVGTALVVVPNGTPEPPPFAGALGTLPAPDPNMVHDPGSLGGYAATLARRGTPLSPELEATARAFDSPAP